MSRQEQMRQDAIRYWHEPVLGGIDLLSARCVQHRFARHAHAEFVLAVFEQGAERFEAQGKTLTAAQGSVLVLPAGVAHTGCAATPEGWTYRAFYPRREMLEDIAADLFRDKVRLRDMRIGIHADARLYARLLRAHRCLSGHGEVLDREVELIGALGMALEYMLRTPATRTAVKEVRAVARARAFIDAHHAEPINGADIAREVGLSLPYLMRAFSACEAVPINVYLTSVRLAHARRLLRAGRDAASVAVEVGFADQSHLIRRFREAYGVTPGRYQRDSRAPVVPSN